MFLFMSAIMSPSRTKTKQVLNKTCTNHTPSTKYCIYIDFLIYWENNCLYLCATRIQFLRRCVLHFDGFFCWGRRPFYTRIVKKKLTYFFCMFSLFFFGVQNLFFSQILCSFDIRWFQTSLRRLANLNSKSTFFFNSYSSQKRVFPKNKI